MRQWKCHRDDGCEDTDSTAGFHEAHNPTSWSGDRPWGWIMRLKRAPDCWHIVLRDNYPKNVIGPFDSLDAAKVAYLLMEDNV